MWEGVGVEREDVSVGGYRDGEGGCKCGRVCVEDVSVGGVRMEREDVSVGGVGMERDDVNMGERLRIWNMCSSDRILL